MAKFILKVALITFASALLVLVVTLLSIAVFVPGKMARIYDDIGFRHRAKIYAEVEYTKNNSFENLLFLSDLSIKCNDDEFIVTYTGALLNDPRLNDYVKSLDGGNDYYDFVASKYIVSNYVSGSTDSEILCKRALENYSSDYREGCAIRALMFRAIHGDESGNRTEKDDEMLKDRKSVV